MAALRRAATALKHWAEGLRIHSDIVRGKIFTKHTCRLHANRLADKGYSFSCRVLQLRSAASNVRTLLQERVSLQAYSFPPRPSPLDHVQGGMMVGNSASYSPMTQWTTVNNMLGTPSSVHSGLPELGSSFSPSTAPSSCFSTPENTYQQIAHKGMQDVYNSSPMSQNSLPLSLPQSMPQSLPQSYPQAMPQQGLPQPCGFAFATPTFVHDQSIYQQQQQLPHLQNQQQDYSQQQQQHHQTYPAGFINSPVNSPDLSFPTELFFDNLCM